MGSGLQADLHWGEGTITLGGHASAGGGLRFGEGEAFVWSGPDAERHARDYRLLHALGHAPADLALPGGRDGIIGKIMNGAVRGGNALLNAAPIVNGVDVRGRSDGWSTSLEGMSSPLPRAWEGCLPQAWSTRASRGR